MDRPGLLAPAVVLVIAATLLVGLLPPAAASGDLTEREELFLQAHGPIRHVVWLDLPPTVFTDPEGRTVGIDPDIHALMSVRLGVEFEYVHANNLSEAIGLLERGEADTISPVVPSAELEPRVDFSRSYVSGGIGFWVDGQRADLSSPEDLGPGATVTAIPGALSQAWLTENRPELTFVEVEGIQEGLEMVRDGAADAYLGAFASVAYLLSSDRSLQGLVPLGDLVVRAEAAFAVPDGNKELLSIVNKGLDAVGHEGFVAIYQKWTGFDLSPDATTTPAIPFYQERSVQIGSAVSLGVVLLLAGNAVVLRRRVRRRTAELAESEERYRGLFEHVPVGLFRSEPSGRMREANDALVEIMGYPDREELLDKNARVHYLDPTQRDRWMETMSSQGTVEGLEMPVRRADGETAWLSFSVRPLVDPDGTVQAFEGAVVDITGRKHAELELREHAEELARSNAELERFAYVASHDLKEPIRMVHSYLQLLQRSLGDELEGEREEFLGFALEGAERMDRLVRDLLEYARVERETGPMIPVDAGAVLDSVLSDLAVTIDETGARIEHDPMPTLLADASQLGQVLTNLLSNALKFQPEGCSPELQIKAEQEGDWWTISVTDNGLGIEPDYQDRIFEVFARLHGRQAYPGTGVGLAICKRVVEHHGGQIRVESVPGEGSTFSFTMPGLGARVDAAEPDAISRGTAP